MKTSLSDQVKAIQKARTAIEKLIAKHHPDAVALSELYDQLNDVGATIASTKMTLDMFNSSTGYHGLESMKEQQQKDIAEQFFITLSKL
jgi:hypothetical protein